MEYEINIFYYIDIYKKWWRKIVLVVFVSVLLTGIFSLRQPVYYKSTVTLLSSSDAKSGQSIGSLLGISSGASSTITTVKAILTSRRMATDIANKFNPENKPGFSYSIRPAEITAGLAVEVKALDPILSRKIANFAVANLDKINNELNLTPSKPMVKVLDPAIRGRSQGRGGSKRVIAAAILSFLLMSVYAFLYEYLNKIKK